MKKIVVFGSGMVGSAIAIDLNKQYDVTVADICETNFEKLQRQQGIQLVKADVTNSTALSAVIKAADLVISAVPGSIGFNTLKNVIENKKNVVDIAFFPEDAFKLDKLAKKMGVTAIVDCGVAPGMSNLLLGYHNKQMSVETFECLVGGLPVKRSLPYEYKAPFSPSDVIEEYIRPARFVENGKIVTRAALSDPELVEFESIGTLEAFNTDGLRSLIKTIKVPNMKEKTLRYPGHIDIIWVLRETGFFNSNAIDVNGQKVVPRDLSSQLLFKLWRLEPDDEEFTVMRIRISGMENGKPKSYIYSMLDRFDMETRTSSMARTTGYTCTAAANLFLEGKYQRKGINPPEFIGEDSDCVDYVLQYLAHRNIFYKRIEKND